MSTDNYIGDELALFALAKNWKNYWRSHIQPLLGNSVLEVGAGTGANLTLLKQQHQKWTALEPDAKQAEQVQQQCTTLNGGKEIEVIAGTLASIESDQRFDSIIYIDVLEHIEQDQNEVTQALEHLNTGGRLIILSPAHQSLFSPFDQSVGHYRRYNKQSLSKLAPDDIELERLFYLDSVGCIASWLNAKILKSGMPTPSQIWLWDSVMVPLSRVMDKLTAHRVGKTIVMVLKNA